MNLIKSLYWIIFCLSSMVTIAEASSETAADQDHSGWYVGGFLGRVAVEADVDLPHSEIAEANAASLGVFGGHHFNEDFGIEFAMGVNGDISDKQHYEERGDYSATVSTITVTPKFTLQVTPWLGLYAKVGLALIIYREDYDNARYNSEDQILWAGGGATGGVGAQVAVSKNLRLRIGIDRTAGDLEALTGDDDYYYDASTDQTIEAPDIEVDITRSTIGLYYQF